MASGTIYRRETPSGASSWVAHATWQEGGKRRQSKRSFRTKKEAQAALTELLAAHQSGTFVAPSRMPLREFVEPWLAALQNQGRKPTTLRGYRRSLDAYVLPRLGDVALQELRASDLDALYAELLRSGGRRGQGLSMTTVHQSGPRWRTICVPTNGTSWARASTSGSTLGTDDSPRNATSSAYSTAVARLTVERSTA